MSDCAYGKGYLLDKLPTRVKYDRWSNKDRNFIGSKKIGHIARKGSLKLTGKNSTRSYKSDSILEETMGFS